VRTALSTLEVVRPRDLSHALDSLHAEGGRARLVPMAGGTDLFVYLNAGTPTGARFLDLWGLRELRGLRVRDDHAEIGALVTFRDLRDHPGIRRHLPALAAAAAEVGAWQIQNRATIGGNVANASPAGDSLPVLLAHEALVRVRSARGERAVPFTALYRGYRDLALEPDELITRFDVPFAPPRTAAFFRKVGTRRAQSISKVVMAGMLRLSRSRRVDVARLAYGSVAPVPLRARHAEALLMGGLPSRGLAARARGALERDIAPIDDVRSERDYRLAVAGNLLEQFLRSADPAFARG
jgi:CO/xanthine dehydrogenase FAD-binding subunit